MGIFNDIDIHTPSDDEQRQTTNNLQTLSYQHKIISRTFTKGNTLWYDVPGYVLNVIPKKTLNLLKLRADINISIDNGNTRCFFRWRVEKNDVFSHNIENEILDIGNRRKSLFSFYSPSGYTSMMTTLSNTSFIRVGTLEKHTFRLQVNIAKGGNVAINKSDSDVNDGDNTYSTSSISVEELGNLSIAIDSHETITVGNQLT